MPTYPKGIHARILLSSVFGPYAQDDEFGSRKINPMELYHNQVTREQGPFSLRMFHRSWGILMIQRNISAPTTVLDFPTREAFERELRANSYDIVGISSIIVNVGKVKEMCRTVRQLAPNATIVVGGHVAAIEGIEKMIDADHIVRGDGISWMRRFLGEDPEAPIRHPEIVSGFGGRTLGIKLPRRKRRHRGDHHSLGRLPHGLQLLHHLGLLRRQGALSQLLQYRRRAVRRHGRHGIQAERPIVFHDGRKLPAA